MELLLRHVFDPKSVKIFVNNNLLYYTCISLFIFRASRRLNYSLLTKQTPTELKSNKATASNSKVADPSLPLAVKRPAYQRLSYLTDPPPPVKTTAASSSEDDGSTVESDTKILSMVDLTLPYSFQVLAERFKCVDAVCSMLQRRKEICTFTKLQKAVQKMTRRYVSSNEVIVCALMLNCVWRNVYNRATLLWTLQVS